MHTPDVEGYISHHSLRRRFVPRRKSDGPLDQDCHFYRSTSGDDALVLLLPLLHDAGGAPSHYHPGVAGIALRYTPAAVDGTAAHVQIDYLPLPGDTVTTSSTSEVWPHDTRDYRTAVALLKAIIKFGNSTLPGKEYVKRVNLDNILTKEAYQDMYIEMKERYGWIIPAWKEKTDPKKHVFEVGRAVRLIGYVADNESQDVAIASFIILLWRQIYSHCDSRPPGGFVDVGCGNGLLQVAHFPPSTEC